MLNTSTAAFPKKKNPASLRQKAPLSLSLWIPFEETTQAENFVFLFCFLSPFIHGGGLKLNKNTIRKADERYKNGMLFCVSLLSWVFATFLHLALDDYFFKQSNWSLQRLFVLYLGHLFCAWIQPAPLVAFLNRRYRHGIKGGSQFSGFFPHSQPLFAIIYHFEAIRVKGSPTQSQILNLNSKKSQISKNFSSLWCQSISGCSLLSAPFCVLWKTALTLRKPL